MKTKTLKNEFRNLNNKLNELLANHENHLTEDLHEQGLIIDSLQKIIEAYQCEMKTLSECLGKKVVEKTISKKHESPFKIISLEFDKVYLQL